MLWNCLPAGGTVNGHARRLPDLAQTCSSSFRSGIGLGQERTPIAAYKVPRRIVQIEDMPRSMLGKILRKQVREQVLSSP